MPSCHSPRMDARIDSTNTAEGRRALPNIPGTGCLAADTVIGYWQAPSCVQSRFGAASHRLLRHDLRYVLQDAPECLFLKSVEAPAQWLVAGHSFVMHLLQAVDQAIDMLLHSQLAFGVSRISLSASSI